MADFVVLGIASSAGTHHAGQENAPQALRAVGLLDLLQSAGLAVRDGGDPVTEVFAADHAHPTRRNLPAVLRVARQVADAVDGALRRGLLPIVLGGDCTITLGVLAGVQRHRPAAGLFYFDGDADLATPERTGSGVLDAMGVAHLLGLADSDLARLTGRVPMLDHRRLVLFGYDEGDHETASRIPAHLVGYADRQVRADPAGCAKAALATLETGSDGVVVHFDVDAVDSGDLPLANFPHYGTGVTLDQAATALAVAVASPALVALVLTEVNPSHDPGGEQLRRYVEAVAGALAGAGA
jgi:arginase